MGKLPDFLIIGEMKCGTTALYNYITEHPQIMPAKLKEINFFNTYYNHGMEWYQSQFPDCNQCITGEASGYLRFPNAADRIYKNIPQVKLIVILRNPIDRVYSHYHMHLKKGKVASPFENAIQRTPAYLNTGKYARKLQKWMELFPEKQIHIIQTEKLFERPRETMEAVYRFLDLPPYSLNVYKHHNTGNYKEMNTKTRKKLVEYYKPHNMELYQLLGMEMDWDQ